VLDVRSCSPQFLLNLSYQDLVSYIPVLLALLHGDALIPVRDLPLTTIIAGLILLLRINPEGLSTWLALYRDADAIEEPKEVPYVLPVGLSELSDATQNKRERCWSSG